MRYTLVYFNKSVRNTIEDWPVEVLADFARMAELMIEMGPTLGLPHSRAMGQGLFELRPRGHGISARVLYGYKGGQKIIIVHAFIKKTRKTPKRHLVLARQRIQEIQGD